MADVVSDLVLSFFCCCFYSPGDHRHRGVGTHAPPPPLQRRPPRPPPDRPQCGVSSPRCRQPEQARVPAELSELHACIQTVELKVKMCCEGCERVVRQALLNLRGVDRVDVNVPMQKVTVTGYVDRARVLQEVRRSGKKAEFWPSGGSGWFTFTSPARSYYFRDDGGGSYRRDGYNYRRHGYSDGDRRHGRMREPAARGAGPVGGDMFNVNDDDVDAGCRIM